MASFRYDAMNVPRMYLSFLNQVNILSRYFVCEVKRVRNKMKIRIFIPKTIYHFESKYDHNCDFIFGKTFCSGESVTIYIIEQRKCSNQMGSAVDLVGQISNSPTAPIGFRLNYIWLERMENTLRIKSINTGFQDSFIVSNKIQFFLYDLDMFTEISKLTDTNEKQKSKLKIDPISELLNLIRLKYETVNNMNKSQAIYSFLIILSTTIQSKLSKIDSALLNHFVFWSTNLKHNIYSKYVSYQ